MLRAGKLIRAATLAREGGGKVPFDLALLAHDERHLRRKVIELVHGDKVLVDFPSAVTLGHGDVLVLDDGRHAEVIAAEEELLEVRGRDAVHLAELAWHIGNRHLAAQIEPHRILILRDHVIRAMLEGLGALTSEIGEPFTPLGGAYSASGHGHGHGPELDHGDDDHHHHAHERGHLHD